MKDNASSLIIKAVDLADPTKTWILIHALTVHFKNYPAAHSYVDPKYESIGTYMVKQFGYYLENIMDEESTFKTGAEKLERVKNVEGNKKAEYIEMFSSVMRSAVMEFIETLSSTRHWDQRAKQLLENTMNEEDPFGILDNLFDKSVSEYELWYLGSQGAMFNASEQRVSADFPVTFLELKIIHEKIRKMTEQLTGLTFKELAARQAILVEINGLITNEKGNGRNKNTDNIARLMELRASFTQPEWATGKPPMTVDQARAELVKHINFRQIPVFQITERRRTTQTSGGNFRANTAKTNNAENTAKTKSDDADSHDGRKNNQNNQGNARNNNIPAPRSPAA